MIQLLMRARTVPAEAGPSRNPWAVLHSPVCIKLSRLQHEDEAGLAPRGRPSHGCPFHGCMLFRKTLDPMSPPLRPVRELHALGQRCLDADVGELLPFREMVKPVAV